MNPGPRSALMALLIGLAALPAAADGPAEAEIRLFAFRPTALAVEAGTTVAWTNRDAIAHSVTHGTPEAPGGLFDSGLFEKDGRFSFVFAQPGTYPYFCRRHPSMTGSVTVEPAR